MPVNSEEVTVFPNPEREYLPLRNEAEGTMGELEIYNVLGEKVYSSSALLTTIK
jgi:hypothetical protein